MYLVRQNERKNNSFVEFTKMIDKLTCFAGCLANYCALLCQSNGFISAEIDSEKKKVMCKNYILAVIMDARKKAAMPTFVNRM